MTHGEEAVILLRAAGVSFAVELTSPVPQVLHWGEDLGPLDGAGLQTLRQTARPATLNNSPDAPRVFSVWPTERDGWSGTPAQSGHAGGTRTTPRPVLERSEVVVAPEEEAAAGGGAGGTIELQFSDAVTAMRSRIRYTLDPHGVLAVDLDVTRDLAIGTPGSSEPYALATLDALLPLPERAGEIADFAGKWCRERSLQRTPVRFGAHRRESRRGKPGHDSPFLTLVGTPGFGFRHGEVWGMHVAWSGNQHTLVEELPEGAGAFRSVLGGGELLVPGEVLIADGESYSAPTVLFTWSRDGMDGVAERIHRRLRARSAHPSTARPLVLNTWEAVYFDHDLDRLGRLAELAAQVGVERVVLDDGWFSGRRDADAGLGDWNVDRAVWPQGLAPFVQRVRKHGMQFGLWFEPEMVNLDSDLAREHPDWLLAPSEGVGLSSRNQYVLDIGKPEVSRYLLERIDALVGEYAIDYIKWDHNRDLSEAVSRGTGTDGAGDRPGVRRQTLALYALLDELRLRHPGLEIETCSGGGGRIDLGILERTDRVWASDCNDPVERLEIERWTSLLLPPELIGSHLGAAEAHTTSRVTSAPFRLATALFAHSGIEWDLTACSEEELEQIATWSAMYREFRSLVHGGRVVNADLADEATSLHGVVGADGRALYAWSRVATSAGGQAGRIRLPGLDPMARYEVRLREDLGRPSRHEAHDPAWVQQAARGWVAVPGPVATVAGLPLPTLNPQQTLLIEVRLADARGAVAAVAADGGLEA
ncbi:alpha-galactosidase [Herbiconiux sp. P17]|uniref:alpha-galactosidase n=1 Tax=Herbiconiux wuyangfengii TaxID=3342794 RepID=UPI0035BA58E1